jgi:hypothetical protein
MSKVPMVSVAKETAQSITAEHEKRGKEDALSGKPMSLPHPGNPVGMSKIFNNIYRKAYETAKNPKGGRRRRGKKTKKTRRHKRRN